MNEITKEYQRLILELLVFTIYTKDNFNTHTLPFCSFAAEISNFGIIENMEYSTKNVVNTLLSIINWMNINELPLNIH